MRKSSRSEVEIWVGAELMIGRLSKEQEEERREDIGEDKLS